MYSDYLINSNLNVLHWSEKEIQLLDACELGGYRFFKLLTCQGLDSYANDFGLQWNSLIDDYSKNQFNHMDEFSRLRINPLDLKDKNILDVGCGMGRLCDLFLSISNVTVGVDLSDSIFKAARYLPSRKFLPIQASASNLPLKSNLFDYVYCWGVLHHTDDPAKVLEELWRVVKPSGNLSFWVYPKWSKKYQKRSLLNFYYSLLDDGEMMELTEDIASFSHLLKWMNSTQQLLLQNDSCFSVFNTKQNTKLWNYDGLGPAYHFLLDGDWFLDIISGLADIANIELDEKPHTVVKIFKKS